MTREDVLQRLKSLEPQLRAKGVARVALFGSLARGDERADSDIDIMLELDPTADIDVFAYFGLQDYVASFFDRRVDVVNRDGLKPFLGKAAVEDAIYAF